MNDTDSKNARLAHIAHLYYEEGLNQQEIAKITSVTRTMVSRLLSEAKDKGIVYFDIKYPWRSLELEEKLKQITGLKDAFVIVDTKNTIEKKQLELGLIAASYFNAHVSDGDIIGISWGSALHHMVSQLATKNYKKSGIVQLIGATGTEAKPLDGPMLARMLSEKLGCDYYPLHTPLIVKSPAIREALMQDPTIENTLLKGAHAKFAWVGIGSPKMPGYSMFREGYLTSKDIDYIVANGAVGDVCAQLFDINGTTLEHLEINRRTVGITLDELSKVEYIVGVAGGTAKNEAVLGAVRGKHVNILITDKEVAEFLINNY
jgi:DNA-binding transcriptional regulator LsrR (DeoR family)